MICVFKCPFCGDEMKYDIEKHILKCSSCEEELKIEDYDFLNMIYDNKRKISENIVGFSCPNCGCEVIVDRIQANVTCPYCDKSMSVFGLNDNEIEPEKIIPFSFNKDIAYGKMLSWWQSKEAMPKFKREEMKLTIEENYIPVWLYNGSAFVGMDAKVAPFEASSKEVTLSSDIFMIHKNVSSSFNSVPIVGSAKTNSKIFHQIEPYEYNELVPFNPGYLSGHKAERYYYSYEDQMPRIVLQLQKYGKDECIQAIETDKLGGTILKSSVTDLEIIPKEVIYALLPIYICSYEYKGKKHQIFINGQTGKVSGEVLYAGLAYKLENAIFTMASAICFAPLTLSVLYFINMASFGNFIAAFFYIIPVICIFIFSIRTGSYLKVTKDDGNVVDLRSKTNINDSIQYRHGAKFSVMPSILFRLAIGIFTIFFYIVSIYPVRKSLNDGIYLLVEITGIITVILVDTYFFIKKRKRYIERHNTVDYYEYIKWGNVKEEPAVLLKTNF